MTLLHKFLKKTFFIFLSILLVVTLMIFGRGYLSYQHIVHDIPIEQKIDTIRKSPNYTPLKEVNPYFKNAIYAVEDCRFYQHGAIDPIGLVRAMSSNIKRRKWREGGSTITQQLAKNIDKEKVHFAELDDGLWQEITAARNSGKLVLCMGAGTIDGWIREQLAKN